MISKENKKIQVIELLSNQIPDFIKEENPLFLDFLKGYFLSKEIPGGDFDIIRNLLEYKKNETLFNLVKSTKLTVNTNYFDTTINVVSTKGWPEEYGLLKINDEIITYESKNETQFLNCKRGFSGVNSLGKYTLTDTLEFLETSADNHLNETEVKNLSILFLEEFLQNIKFHFLPGFEDVSFYENINDSLIASRIVDFYTSKGTENSFDLLFKILYGEESQIFLPKNNIIKPSSSDYGKTNEIIVEVISGNVESLKGYSIYQDEPYTEGIVYDVNFLKRDLYPEKTISVDYIQNGNVITVTGVDHGINTGDNLYFEVTTGNATSKVHAKVQRKNSNEILILDDQSINTSGKAKILTIKQDYKLFYSLKLNSIDGNFIFNGKTKLLESASKNSEIITVDSTLGFPKSGSILIGSESFSYQSKTSNQFFGCSPRDNNYDIGDVVSSNRFVYGYENGNINDIVTLRVVDITSSNFENQSPIIKENSKISIKNIGYEEENYFTESLLYNTPVDLNVSNINFDVNTISFETPHRIKKGEKINIKSKFQRNRFGVRNSNLNSFPLEVLSVNPQQPNLLEVNLSGIDRSIKPSDIVCSKVLQKGNSNSSTFGEINKELANINKVFIDKSYENYYVCSSSIPDYVVNLNSDSHLVKKIVPFSQLKSDNSITIQNHNYLSGDQVFFVIKSNGNIAYSRNFYISKIDNDNIKIFTSRSSVFSNDNFDINQLISDNSISGTIIFEIQKYELFDKNPKNQKLLKRIKIEKNKGEYYDFETKPYHSFGILSNGVELYPPFEDETITYGKVESVSVLNSGSNYDILNVPEAYFDNSLSGIGASVYLGCEGQLKEILVVNGGKNVNFDLKIKVSGGNDTSVDVRPVFSTRFESKVFSPQQDVSLLNDTITFSTNHNFINGEEVKYSVIGVGNTAIGLSDGSKLVSDSNYFVNVVNNTKVRLSNTKSDALSNKYINFGVNFGTGDHQLVSIKSKNTLESVNILNPGKFKVKSIKLTNPKIYPKNNNYEYVLFGINLNSNYIFYRDHYFQDGDVIQYVSLNSPISGLVNNNFYYIKTIDKNSFRLYHAGDDLDNLSDSKYLKDEYSHLTFLPANGTHIFRYPQISVTIDNDRSVITPQIESIIRGSIVNVTMASNGRNYGSEIINFEKEPNLRIYRGSGAAIGLIIRDGKISYAYVINSGKNYYSEPELIINSTNGKYGRLKAIVSNGKIVDVKIINQGVDYESTSTVSIRNIGQDVRFKSNVQKWRVNAVQRNILNQNNIDVNLGVINEHYLIGGRDESSQIVCSYVPKQLRSRYGDSENRSDSDIVNETFSHSKIVGWAYDGNPIYAQFGYSNANSVIDGIKRLKSGYDIVPISNITSNTNRPGNISEFPQGFFIEDYYFANNGDLDEYNGRYCITPEFPNGTYAYFSTLNVDGLPGFPYCIYGLKEKYDSWNRDFLRTNQDYIENISSDLVSITYSNRLFDPSAEYSFLDRNIDDFEINVTDVSRSVVNEIFVIESGDNYKNGDKITIKNNAEFGSDSKAIVSALKGKKISEIKTNLNLKENINFEIASNYVIGISTVPHELSNRDNVRVSIGGITTSNFTFLNGSYPISLNSLTSRIIEDIPNAGLTTYLKLSDSVSSFNLRPDDVIKINNEKMKVLSIDIDLNQVKVSRSYDGTIKSSHTSSDEISILPSTFKFITGIKTTTYTETYRKHYFSKSQVGIGTTQRTISFVGINTQIKVGPKKIYIPNHNFKTNQKVKYSFSVGTGLTVSTESSLTPSFNLLDNQSLFIVRYDNNFIGLSTFRVSVGNSNPGLYFIDVDDENQYDQSLSFNNLPSGSITELETVVSTSSTHGLSSGDFITLNPNPNYTNNITIEYDEETESILLSPQVILSTGISSIFNYVRIPNHGLENGDLVKYEDLNSITLGQDFVSGKKYHVRVFSENLFGFAKTKFDAENDNLLNIGITTANHRIYRVNPSIRVVKGSKINIGISSISLEEGNPRIEFYQDSDLKIKFDTTKFTTINNNEIVIDTNNIPNQVFFTILKFGSKIGGSENKVSSINVFDSLYQNTFNVSGIVSERSFNIELNDLPEVNTYNSSNSNSSYTTISKTAFGPIERVLITDRGDLFKYPDGEVSIDSEYGQSSILKYDLRKVDGSSNNVKINKVPFDLSGDETYTYNLDIPSIVSVKSSKKLSSVNIIQSGKNYISPPKVTVLDEPNIILSSSLNGKSVSNVNLITKNNPVLKDSITIFPEFNSNGNEVINVTKESNNTTINLFLKEPNNGFREFPFEIGDKIFVEGIVNTDDDPGDGYNSIDYGLTYFTIIGINTTTGSSRIRYSIVGLGTTAGTYDSLRSYPRVVKESDIVKFEAVLEPSQYFGGETVFTESGYEASVDDDGWSQDNNVVSLKDQSGILNIGDILIGGSSGSRSIVTKIDDYDSTISKKSTLNYFSKVNDDIGKLNEQTQVISDNFYYQSFSYDIRSGVPFKTWESTVDNLNHLSGYEKFGTVILPGISSESKTELSQGESSSTVFIEPEIGDFYQYKAFDIVNETSTYSGEFFFSKEIVFLNRQITDSIESVTNRAILIDDISDQFTGKLVDSDGSRVSGITSFRLTTSETGSKSSLFVKYFDSADDEVVILDEDKIYIPDHNFSTGEKLEYISYGTKVSIASTDRVIGGLSTSFIPDEVYVINLDQNNIRLCGLSSDVTNNRYFDFTSLGTGSHKLKSTNQNTRCLICLDGIIQSPLYNTELSYTLNEPIGVGSTTITLTGVTSITSNSILEIESELLQVDVIGYGNSEYKLTVDRGFMGTVAAAHTVGAAVSLKKGEYILRDDVIYFAEPPISGVNTNFNYSSTGIPTSFSRMKFHGRVMQRLNYDENKIFDDITERFNGSNNLFTLKSNGESTEDIFSNNVGVLTGTDVNSGIILINNIFQIPNTDYQLIQNVGVGASIEFLGNNNETLPSGGQILEYTENNGSGYQQLTRASGIISSLDLLSGSIINVTLTESGSGYREDVPVNILSRQGIGASIVALVGSGVNAGFITGFRVDDGGNNYSSSQLPIVEVPFPRSYSNLPLSGGSGTGAKVDIVVVGAAGTVFQHKLTDIGYGYREGDILTVTGIPKNPKTLYTIATEDGNAILTENDNIIIVEGEDYYSDYSNFEIEVNKTFKDKFSGYTFGELILFDDISSEANGFRNTFSLSRTRSGSKELVSLDAPKGSPFKLQNNLLIFINDILQIPDESYVFDGGTRVRFKEAPKRGSKIVILYFKGSDDDVVEIDIRETIKIGDTLQLDKENIRNASRQLPRPVFDILSSDTAETNIYNNIGLSTDETLDRTLHWTKQKFDEIINNDIVYKTRPELTSNVIPNVNLIKDLGKSDTEIFVDTIKEFEIDSQGQSNIDLICIDSKYSFSNQAKATLNIIDGFVNSVSISTGGYGYYENPQVSLISPVPLKRQIGSEWISACEDQFSGSSTITGITTISVNTQVSDNTVYITSGSTLIINQGVTYTISGFGLTSSSLYDIDFSSKTNTYYVVGNDGLVAYSNNDLCEFFRYPFDEITNDPDPVYSVDVVERSSEGLLIAGKGFVGFASVIGDTLDIQKSAYPVSSGGIEAGTYIDETKKVSIENQTFNFVRYFPTMNGMIAVGSTIMTSKDITSDNGNKTLGYDWNLSRINFGGPNGTILNDIEYFPKKEFTNRPSSTGYVAVGQTGYVFKSFDGYKWNTQNTTKSFRVSVSAIPQQARLVDLNSIATDNNSLVAVGNSGVIIRTESIIKNTDPWSYYGIGNTSENFTSVTYTGDQYIIVSDMGNVYTSIGGTSWVKQTSITNKPLNSIIYADYSGVNKQTLVSVGINTIIKSDEKSTEAIVTSSVTNGIVTSLTITNPGFGYSSTNPPIIQIAPPKAKYERIENCKVEGDFGNVVSISTVTGIGTDYAIQFEFEIDPILNDLLYSNFNFSESGIKTGYYFAINKNVFGNYTIPMSGIDTTNSYSEICSSSSLNNLYRADKVVVSGTGSGIVTVTSNVNNIEEISNDLNSNVGISTKLDYLAKYSWGRFYDFIRPDTKFFEILDTFENLTNNPTLQRLLSLKENY